MGKEGNREGEEMYRDGGMGDGGRVGGVRVTDR